jgi:hypothetical protein
MTQTVVGSIVSLWRYPVKSMLGEELDAGEVTKRGLLGIVPTRWSTAPTGRLQAPRTRGSVFAEMGFFRSLLLDSRLPQG